MEVPEMGRTYAVLAHLDGRRGTRNQDEPCVNTVGVANLDVSLALAEQSGGTCVVPKMPPTGVGWLAYCEDTEGHIFGMIQNDPSAA
jgi:predicted enzyme related to lactoylglutathione lyase